MTSFEEHAASSGGPECHRVRELPQRPTALIVEDRLLDADEVTDHGQFPEHGQWMAVIEREGLTSDGGDDWADDRSYWECPSGLAQEVMDGLAETELEAPTDGLAIEVVQAVGGGEEPWSFRTTVFDADV